MTQALLNNLIKQPDLSEKMTSSKVNVSSNFQKIFDKQNFQEKNINNTQNEINKNNTQEDEGSRESAIEKNSENNSVVREIKDLIAYLEATKNSSETTDTEDEDSENCTENLTSANTDAGTILEEISTGEEKTDDTNSKEICTDSVSQTILSIQNAFNNTNDEIAVQKSENENQDSDLQVILNGREITSIEDLTNPEQSVETTATGKTEIQESTEGKNLEDIVDEDILKELKIESTNVETQSDSNSNTDLLQSQSPEEQGLKAMLQTDADFTSELKHSLQTQVPAQNVSNKSATAEITPSKIIEQITKQMEGLQNSSKVNIVLNPESLGKVSIQLINTKEGLSAQFTVASQEARNLIMKGLDGLKDTLLTHGVSIDNVTVKLNDTQESEYNTDWTEQEGSRGGNKEEHSQRKGQEEKERFEQMMSFVENENGKV